MLHRNTIIALCAVFCAVAVGAGLFVADMSKQTVLVTQQSGQSAASQPPTAAAAQPTPEADTPTAAEPSATSDPVAAIDPAEPSPTSQPEPTTAPAPTTAASSTAAAYIEYTVQKGDLLNNIAKKYNVTTKQILAINDIPNADSLTVGQVIRIPKV